MTTTAASPEKTSPATSKDDRWPSVYVIAQAEIRRLGEGLKELNELHDEGQLDTDQAFEIICARWEGGKTAIRRARRAQAVRRAGRSPQA